MFNKDAWLNTDPITKNHVRIMTCKYSGYCDYRDVLSSFRTHATPISVWIRDHVMEDRTRFDYRAERKVISDMIKVRWYLVFENEEDKVLFLLAQDSLFEEIIEGM